VILSGATTIVIILLVCYVEGEGETYRANVGAQGLERLEELLVGAHDGEIDQRVLSGTSKTKRVREISEASKTMRIDDKE
jgi:hypothetical protein